MKRILSLLAVACGFQAMAQSNINEVLAAGLDDAERFTTDYIAPASEGFMYSLSSGWYNTADAKPLGGFEISIIGNMAGFKNKDDKKTFEMNVADYDNLKFVDGSTSKLVSTSLGDIENVMVYVEDENGLFREDFELPTGLASENINFVPSGFVQASVGLIKGTEIKARFLPKISTDDYEIGMYGVGIQHELTKHLPADKILPIAISAVIGYTHLDGSYDFTNSNIVAGQDQKLEVDVNTWVFQAVVSTKLPIINFYGGLGYITGKSTTDVLGTYVVQSGPFQQTYEDPFSIDKKANGVTANIGTKLKLGFFRLHADYALAEFNTLSVGVNFGFR
ncbi:DUF6588 family protein [Maribacter sp. TH_r10]|uniref:DUF6588 family protein n=1 Tax=Maribacter sp. TH_r10 TaxID=3082086 RepID=UPI002954E3C1|nr:DUF6588 family protein [Maribacter sp. TH_r10]MDV7140844.1 DUF6588 family protein [Maribacter sp. TH_r10]